MTDAPLEKNIGRQVTLFTEGGHFHTGQLVRFDADIVRLETVRYGFPTATVVLRSAVEALRWDT